MGTRIIFFFTLFLVFLGSLTPIGSDDTFMNLSLGRHLLSNGSFPATDPYLFTIPDFHWHVWHEWLAYVYYFSLFKLSGFTGIIVVRALWLTAFATLLLRLGTSQAPRSSATTTKATLLALIVLLTFIVGFERCRADRASFFGDLFAAETICFLLHLREPSNAISWRKLWPLPLLFLVWANIHPSFPIGWVFLGTFTLFSWRSWTPSQRKTWLTMFALCIGFTAANPLGLQGMLYPIKAFAVNDFSSFKEINSEWMPTFFSDQFGTGMKWRVGLFLSLGVAVALIALKQRRYFEFALVLLLSYLSFSSVRFVSIGAFGIGAVMIRELCKWPPLKSKVATFGTASALAGATWMLLFAQPGFGASWAKLLANGGVFLPNIPIGAAKFMATVPPGNIFNEYTTGGLLAWELNGRMKIAGHGHIDQPQLIKHNYYRYTHSPADFRDIIGNGNVDYFFVYKSDLEFASGAGWVQELVKFWLKIYSDDAAVVFKRIHDYKATQGTR